jgi:hypothetical protein
MNRYVVTAFLVFSFACFAGGWIGGYYSAKPEVKTITQKEIEWKDRIVYREVSAMTERELREQLQKYYTDRPMLEISIAGDTVKAEAGLVERRWSREARINLERPENMIIGGVGYGISGAFLDTGYVRLFGGIGIGCSLVLGQGFVGAKGVCLYMF